MTTASLMTAPPAHDSVRDIAAFFAAPSFETTRLAEEDVAALATAVPAGTRVYVSAIPSRPPDAQLAIARRLRAAGHEPVPHVAVRAFAGPAELDRVLARLVDEAGVRVVLVIGGDREQPAGAFHSAIEAIESGVLQSRGIAEVGIAGYPDGHPRIAPLDLDRALVQKIEAAQETGLSVTQFAFAAGPILAWIARLREQGIDLPMRLGLAGPTRLTTLMRYARVCGVRASAQSLARNAGLVKNLFGLATPDDVVRPLAEACAGGRLGEVTPHVYSFGGLATALRWASAIADGRITLGRDAGFSVEPPHAG
jgi:methylenetetrahydrofolate reductase (NADPH)